MVINNKILEGMDPDLDRIKVTLDPMLRVSEGILENLIKVFMMVQIRCAMDQDIQVIKVTAVLSIGTTRVVVDGMVVVEAVVILIQEVPAGNYISMEILVASKEMMKILINPPMCCGRGGSIKICSFWTGCRFFCQSKRGG
jgi:hypothetical protein